MHLFAPIVLLWCFSFALYGTKEVWHISPHYTRSLWYIQDQGTIAFKEMQRLKKQTKEIKLWPDDYPLGMMDPRIIREMGDVFSGVIDEHRMSKVI